LGGVPSAGRGAPPRYVSGCLLNRRPMIGGVARRRRKLSVLLELAVANALASQLFVRELTRAGYPFTHVGLLTLIDMFGPITPSDLEHETAIPKTTLRGRLRGLYGRGLIQRVPNPEDKRSHFVGVTADGKRFLREMEPVVRATERVIEAELGSSLEDYRVQLERLRAAEQKLPVPRRAMRRGRPVPAGAR
jgi:DNA-binding MarR family transcriptional regulator